MQRGSTIRQAELDNSRQLLAGNLPFPITCERQQCPNGGPFVRCSEIHDRLQIF